MVKIDIKEMRDIQKKMIRMLKNKKKYGGAHTETIHLKNCVRDLLPTLKGWGFLAYASTRL